MCTCFPMPEPSIQIVPIARGNALGARTGNHAVCWIQREVPRLRIGHLTEEEVAGSMYFIGAETPWEIKHRPDGESAGYALYIPNRYLNDPRMSRLHINEVRLLAGDQIARINLAPGIAKRTQAVLEMLDELNGSQLNHKEEGILSLLNTFFIYCDGQCNIRSVGAERNSKKKIVFQFKKLIHKHYLKRHEVRDYANMLHISDKYLNECVNEVLGVNAKSLIDEQRIMRSRHLLKFSDLAIKEICYELGFSSPDYFGYYLKKHTGMTPSMIRKS